MNEPDTILIEDNRPSVFSRCMAKSLDISVVLFLNTVFPVVAGAVLGFIYMLIHDGLFAGQSPGKKMLKLKSVNFHTRLPCSYKESAIRNATIGIAAFFSIISFCGWILAVLV